MPNNPRNYTSIGVEKPHFEELRSVKHKWEQRAGRRFYWSDFLMMLVTLQDLPEESIQTVEMRQHAADEEPLSPEQLRETGLEYDEEMTREVSQLRGFGAELSEAEVEAIAKRVAEKVVAKLQALNNDKDKLGS